MNKGIILFILFFIIGCNPHPYEHGKRIYDAYCSNCHMPDGKGLRQLIPPLAQSDYLRDHQEHISCIILHGQEGPIQVNGVIYDQVMPSSDLTDIQVNNLINYINNEWGNQYGVVHLKDTKAIMEECDSANDND